MQVMNCNAGSKHAVGLVGYVPKIEVSEAEKETNEYKDAKFYVLQQCIVQIDNPMHRKPVAAWISLFY